MTDLLQILIHDESFDPPLDSEFICCICTDVIKEPVLTGCGHHFCKSCIDSHIKIDKSCPMDREDLSGFSNLYFPDKAMERKLLGKTVWCSNKCEWKGLLSDLKKHFETCPMALISCKDCNMNTLRKDYEDHWSVCPERSISCEYCKQTFKANELQKHFDDCDCIIVSCPNGDCSEQFERRFVTEHIKICPHQIIPCMFDGKGCDMKLARKDMQDHMINRAYIHFQLLLQEIENLREEHKQEIEQLKAQFHPRKKAIAKPKNANEPNKVTHATTPPQVWKIIHESVQHYYDYNSSILLTKDEKNYWASQPTREAKFIIDFQQECLVHGLTIRHRNDSMAPKKVYVKIGRRINEDYIWTTAQCFDTTKNLLETFRFSFPGIGSHAEVTFIQDKANHIVVYWIEFV